MYISDLKSQKYKLQKPVEGTIYAEVLNFIDALGMSFLTVLFAIEVHYFILEMRTLRLETYGLRTHIL